jgi:DNA-binding transcriptional MerR regulator
METSVQAECGIRISDAAATAGVSPRTLRYYEELGLLTPSLYTPGGERRYTEEDLLHLKRILELREVLGMNLEVIKEFLSFDARLDLAEQLNAKLARMDTFRAKLAADAQRCRQLLSELG